MIFGPDWRGADAFHNYSLAWTNASMAWSIDGVLLYEYFGRHCGAGPALERYHPPAPVSLSIERCGSLTNVHGINC